ncbi:unnamed protein product [Rotaria magnacalcarata]|uniref:Uncharacterized protein n=1 Tax=Rotaria magnacalcarata TaxID=392030 RepID=A0A815NRK0_9BILA|nr:unnamed protein product [Rotaria magnacalcarata]CAF1566184.1 unnamed protein product [Rotaria magnacalcarata]CAF3913404.1 unnamed protein product [Rotaria magnacalcarata]CAF4283761.1 unnamed protein product [Rotaria magnacalcarata]
MGSSNSSSSSPLQAILNSMFLIISVESSNSNVASDSSSFNTKSLDSTTITYLLLHQRENFKVIENPSPSHAVWWRSYEFPAQLNKQKKFERVAVKSGLYRLSLTSMWDARYYMRDVSIGECGKKNAFPLTAIIILKNMLQFLILY